MTCYVCRGDFVETTTAIVFQEGDYVIVLKKVPCQKCSQCGETVFSDKVVGEIEDILDRITADAIHSDIILDYRDEVRPAA